MLTNILNITLYAYSYYRILFIIEFLNIQKLQLYRHYDKPVFLNSLKGACYAEESVCFYERHRRCSYRIKGYN